MKNKKYSKREISNYLEGFKSAIPNRLEQAKKLLKKEKIDYSYEEERFTLIIKKERFLRIYFKRLMEV